MLSTKFIRRKKLAFLAITCFSHFFVNPCLAEVAAQDTAQEIDLESVQVEQQPVEPPKATLPHHFQGKRIRNIIITGNEMVPRSVILSKIPYKKGEFFDRAKTRMLIHNLYYDLKRFRNIFVNAKDVDDQQMDLYIDIKEKTKIKKIEFDGNKKLTEKEINKGVDFSDVPALDLEELELYAKQIKKVYSEKSYNNATITPELKIDTDGEGIAIFHIDEGKKAVVKRVRFTGNKAVSGKDLRNIIYTKEDWILNFVDGAGKYQPERIEADKHAIESYYQNHGYMMAKVMDVKIVENPKTRSFDITFEIEEGDLFKFGKVEASGNDILKDDYIISRLPVQKDQLYSREKIMDSIKALEGLWGEMGYVYTNIDPAIKPDEEAKTVDISFEADLGNKIYLNKINIFGNKKTHDKIIRRKLLLSEGQLLTESLMDASKYRVEALGFFDQKEGVIWRKRRVDDTMADLDLILKEVKTGSAHLKMGFGGSMTNMQSSVGGFSIGGEVADRNLFGTGVELRLNASWAKEEQSILFNITQPWLFDKPIMGAFDIYHRRPHYDDFRHCRSVVEKLTGGGVTFGFSSRKLREAQIIFRGGFDRVLYEQPPLCTTFSGCEDLDRKDLTLARTEFQCVLDKEFEPGKFAWFEFHAGMDKRNHPIHPSRGYKWLAVSRTGIPTFGCNIGFQKFDIDFDWYTPLIGERDLVFRFHGYFGLVSKFKNRNVPYRELFHIGGPATVRGFLFGQAGPQFVDDSIGGSKGSFINIELAFPITPDFNMKGVVFYDAGCGWDNPYSNCVSKKFLKHNTFNYRHSVGAGIRLYNPVPVRIDWGFKLNRDKKLHESPGEVHFGMSYDF